MKMDLEEGDAIMEALALHHQIRAGNLVILYRRLFCDANSAEIVCRVCLVLQYRQKDIRSRQTNQIDRVYLTSG